MEKTRSIALTRSTAAISFSPEAKLPCRRGLRGFEECDTYGHFLGVYLGAPFAARFCDSLQRQRRNDSSTSDASLLSDARGPSGGPSAIVVFENGREATPVEP